MNVFCGVKASTLVVVEHDGGVLKGSSISAIAAASALGEGSTVQAPSSY
jgi:electron transfer flavoprotein alpha subunit